MEGRDQKFSCEYVECLLKSRWKDDQNVECISPASGKRSKLEINYKSL